MSGDRPFLPLSCSEPGYVPYTAEDLPMLVRLSRDLLVSPMGTDSDAMRAGRLFAALESLSEAAASAAGIPL